MKSPQYKRCTLLLVMWIFTTQGLAQGLEGYDVFLIAGQSNTLMGCCADPDSSLIDPDIMQLGRYENDYKIIPALDPLNHHSMHEDRVGFATTFARLYKEKYLKPGRKILLIPCGKGGTGFIDRNWNPGDSLYNDAVKRTNYILEHMPNSELKAILWHQGERDVKKKNKHYQNDLDSMFTHLRRDLLPKENTPIILGGMVPYWVEQSRKRIAEQKIISSTPNRLPRVWFADPCVPFKIVKPDNDFDAIHFSADGQREMGKRYFLEWEKIQEDLK